MSKEFHATKVCDPECMDNKLKGIIMVKVAEYYIFYRCLSQKEYVIYVII